MNIRDHELVIRNATRYDAAILCKWWNNGAVMEHAGYPNGLGISIKEVVQQIKSHSDKTYRRLIIEMGDQPIGEMSYRNMGELTAQIGIKICETDYREKGLGTRLLKLFIESLFDDLGYEKIILDTDVDNKRAQHVYEKLGFKKVSTRINSHKDQIGRLRSTVDYELVRKFKR